VIEKDVPYVTRWTVVVVIAWQLGLKLWVRTPFRFHLHH